MSVKKMKLDSDIGGMNQYLHQAAGFRAIIKHRYFMQDSNDSPVSLILL
jgi:hypothetical protein